MPFVVDASVAVKWFALEDRQPLALAMLAQSDHLIAPDLVMVEVMTALSRKVRERHLDANVAMAAIASLRAVFTEFPGTSNLAERGLALSLDVGHPFPDCLYLALAEQRGCPLVTDDVKFVAALAGTPHAGRAVALADWAPAAAS